jgi:hypothetical protein
MYGCMDCVFEQSEETKSLPCVQGQGLIFGVPCEFQCPALVTNMMMSSLYFDHRLYLKGKSWIDRIVTILVPKSKRQTSPSQKKEGSEKDVSRSTITPKESEPPTSRTMIQVDLDIRDCVVYHRPSSKEIQSSGMICPQFVHLSTRLFTNSKEFHVHVRLSDAPFFLHPSSKGDVLFMRKSRQGIAVTENPLFRSYLKVLFPFLLKYSPNLKMVRFDRTSFVEWFNVSFLFWCGLIGFS